MAIYTKRGDKGKTSIFSGKRLSKASKLISTIGAVDELNSFLGIIGGLSEIQKNLFTINAILAGTKLTFPEDAIKKLEKKIDKIEGKLPVQKNFLIYGGAKKATELYFARALCRRTEREMVNLKVKPALLMYINRLSDYLFILARKTNYKAGVNEEVWKAKGK